MELLNSYLQRYRITQKFSLEDVLHWELVCQHCCVVGCVALEGQPCHCVVNDAPALMSLRRVGRPALRLTGLPLRAESQSFCCTSMAHGVPGSWRAGASVLCALWSQIILVKQINIENQSGIAARAVIEGMLPCSWDRKEGNGKERNGFAWLHAFQAILLIKNSSLDRLICNRDVKFTPRENVVDAYVVEDGSGKVSTSLPCPSARLMRRQETLSA
eukprot:1160062-Pelagomonas_calceolata.AAC.7